MFWEIAVETKKRRCDYGQIIYAHVERITLGVVSMKSLKEMSPFNQYHLHPHEALPQMIVGSNLSLISDDDDKHEKYVHGYVGG